MAKKAVQPADVLEGPAATPATGPEGGSSPAQAKAEATARVPVGKYIVIFEGQPEDQNMTREGTDGNELGRAIRRDIRARGVSIKNADVQDTIEHEGTSDARTVRTVVFKGEAMAGYKPKVAAPANGASLPGLTSTEGTNPIASQASLPVLEGQNTGDSDEVDVEDAPEDRDEDGDTDKTAEDSWE